MKSKKTRLMAYFYMPLIFCILGYSVFFLALSPVFDMLQVIGDMVIADEIPTFNQNLDTIYDPVLAQQQLELQKKQETNPVVSIKSIETPNYGTQYGNISCETIGLDAPVYWGDSKEILKAGVGQYIGSFMPGFGKTILISGHNTTYFKCLQNIAVGNIIFFSTNYGVFEYEVENIEIIHMNDAETRMRDTLSADKEELIMYTCYPFEKMVGRKVNRYFIFAKKLSGPVVQ